MLGNLLLAIGVVCLLLGILALLHVLALPASTLLIVAIITLVAGYFLRGVGPRVP